MTKSLSMNPRNLTQRIVGDLPYDEVPEMVPPQYTTLTKAPVGYSRDIDIRPDAPYFNASVYCNRVGLRFSLWLRNPPTIALIKALGSYYRESSHEIAPALVMLVKGGARVVRGYYIHIMLHDALSSWCDFELIPLASRPRLPTREATAATTVVYTQTLVSTPEEARDRMARVISAARGGTHA